MNPARRPALSIATLLSLVVLLGLGTWQAKKVSWKQDLIDRVEARTTAPPVPLSGSFEGYTEYFHVALSGVFEDSDPAFVNGTFDGEPGWYAFQVFLPTDPSLGPVLVNRGFVTDDARRAKAIDPPPVGKVTINALVRPYREPSGFSRLFIAPASPEKGEFYSRASGPLHSYFAKSRKVEAPAPIYLDMWPDSGTGSVPRAGTTRVEFHEKHLGYAVTWYGLAIGLVVVYGVMMRRSAQSRARGH